jgi:hypothetical protein
MTEYSKNTNGMIFQNSDGSRKLSITFLSGDTRYEGPGANYSLINLAIGVPQTSQMPELATVLGKLHISFSDITGWIGSNNIEFTVGDRLAQLGIDRSQLVKTNVANDGG